MEPLLLGIDIGTSACKVALFAPDGRVQAQASHEYPVHHPRPGWAQQDPIDWWNGVCAATRAMLQKSGLEATRIAGVGIDGQGWSAIPLAADGRVLHPTPIWMDTRSAGICAELAGRIGEEKIFEVCGNPLQPTYTLPKILWYKQQVPEVYEQADKILQSNSYIAYRLTGAISQDMCQSYGYQCFDMRKGVWDDALCEEMGIRRSLLPDIVPCHAIVGVVTAEAETASGIPAGTPVVAGGLDAACGALGAGVLRSGETQEQGGQAGGMSICMDTYHADPRLILGYHVAPGRWLLQGGSVGGGGILNWFAAQLGAAEEALAAQNGTNVYIELDKLAETVPPGAGGVTFLPYMAGERSPIWNPNAKGVFYGLDYSKTRGHMVRAALESVAYSLRHNLLIAEQAGAPVGTLRSMGGAANSRLWTQMKSDVTAKPIEVPTSDTATTLGAALLAGVATGVYQSFEDAVDTTVQVTRTHAPNPDPKPAYDEAFEAYLNVYNCLKPMMQKGSNS